jgi:hypothetical protein
MDLRRLTLPGFAGLLPFRAMLGAQCTQGCVPFLRDTRQGRRELLRPEAQMGCGKFRPILLKKTRFGRSLQRPERG